MANGAHQRKGQRERKARRGNSLRLIKAYIDTNILIDYCWATFFSEKSSRKSKSVLLVNKGAMGLFDMHISFYTLMELANHFTQYFLEQKAIKSGYSYPESFRQNYCSQQREIDKRI